MPMHLYLPCLAVLACLAACAPTQGNAASPSPQSKQHSDASPAPPSSNAGLGADPGSGPDAGAAELPRGRFHGNWRVVAVDDPHDQALMALSIQSSAGESRGSGDYTLFQPFCDAVDDAPIHGTADCELIGLGAAFNRVDIGEDRILLIFHPTADGAEHRLELRRHGDALAGDYVFAANGIHRAIRAQRGIDESGR